MGEGRIKSWGERDSWGKGCERRQAAHRLSQNKQHGKCVWIMISSSPLIFHFNWKDTVFYRGITKLLIYYILFHCIRNLGKLFKKTSHKCVHWLTCWFFQSSIQPLLLSARHHLSQSSWNFQPNWGWRHYMNSYTESLLHYSSVKDWGREAQGSLA